MKKFLLLAVMLLFILISTNVVFAQPLDQMIDTSTTNKYVRVYFSSGSEEIAQICVDIANEHIDWIKDVKGLPLEQIPVPIFLYSNRQDFRLSQVMDVQGAEGVTLLWYPKILVYFNGSFLDLRHVVTHELNHFVTFDYLTRNYKDCVKRNKKADTLKYDYKYDMNPYFSEVDEPARKYFEIFLSGNLPLWLCEGIAEAWSNPYQAQKECMIRDCILWHGPYNIWELMQYPSFLTIYKMGESAVEFMEQQAGDYAVKTFLDYACSESVNKAFSVLFGFEEETALVDFNKYWRMYLVNKYFVVDGVEQLYLDSPDTLNVGLASWAVLGGKATYSYRESQVQITNGDDVFAKDHNMQDNDLGTLTKKASVYEKYLIYSSLHNRKDIITIYDLEKKKRIETFRFENIVCISSPVYNGKTIVFIGQRENGFENIMVMRNRKYYQALRSDCDIRSLVLHNNDIFFISDLDTAEVYDLYKYSMKTRQVKRLTKNINARNLTLSENKGFLLFVVDGKKYNYLCFYDLAYEYVYISSPLVEYIQFPYVGKKVIVTMLANGKYYNYTINPIITTTAKYNIKEKRDSWYKIYKKHKVTPAKFKWHFTISDIIMTYDDYFGTQAEGLMSVIREDGTKRWQFIASENGIGVLKSWHQLWSTKFLAFQWYNLYRFYTTRNVIKERSVAFVGGYIFKLDEYSEVYSSLMIGNRRRSFYLSWNDSHYGGIYFKYPGKNQFTENYKLRPTMLNFDSHEDFAYKRYSKGYVSNLVLSFYRDITRYSQYWAPLAGTKFWLYQDIDVDFTNKKIVSARTQAILIKYFSLGDPMCWAHRIAAGKVIGAYPLKYELGGPTSFRGREWLSMYVKNYWLYSMEVRLPFAYYAGIFGKTGQGFILHHIKIKLFGDIGQAWNKKPKDVLWDVGFGLSGWFGYTPLNLYWVYNSDHKKFRPFLSLSYDF